MLWFFVSSTVFILAVAVSIVLDACGVWRDTRHELEEAYIDSQ